MNTSELPTDQVTIATVYNGKCSLVKLGLSLLYIHFQQIFTSIEFVHVRVSSLLCYADQKNLMAYAPKNCFSNFVQEFLVNLRLVFKIRNKFPLELVFYLIQ